MNKIILTVLILLLVVGNSIGQKQQINLVLLIDNQAVLPHDISNTFLIVQKSDTIHLDYELGLLRLGPVEYKHLLSLPKNTSLTLNCNYIDRSDDKFQYSIKLEAHYLQQEYILIQLYNYSNKCNRGQFPQKKGYGCDIDVPSTGIRVARMKKYMRNRCNRNRIEM